MLSNEMHQSIWWFQLHHNNFKYHFICDRFNPKYKIYMLINMPTYITCVQWIKGAFMFVKIVSLNTLELIPSIGYSKRPVWKLQLLLHVHLPYPGKVHTTWNVHLVFKCLTFIMVHLKTGHSSPKWGKNLYEIISIRSVFLYSYRYTYC